MATGRVPTTANSPLTAKGDLFGYSTTQARVPVGSDGETLVADSSATTGLRWQGDYAAGKNKVINGAFDIWQRGTSFNIAAYTPDVYAADRWQGYAGSGTATMSRQAFTAGAAPVAGYESQYFFRYNQTVSAANVGVPTIYTKIEDVRTLAGQTVTVSFWAKAGASATVTGQFDQNFGSGGSATVTTSTGSFSVTTSWARYSATVSLPSISGKTVGTSSYLTFVLAMPTSGTYTIDYWGFQLESGNVATAFQTATGTLAGELAAAQRYYFRSNNGGNAYARYGIGRASSATNIEAPIYLPVPMRVAPTSVDFSTLTTTTSNTITAIALNQPTTNVAFVDCTSSSLTTGQAVVLMGNNSTSAYIGFSAEL